MFRIEGELGYKHAGIKIVTSHQPGSAQSTPSATPSRGSRTSMLDLGGGHVTVLSGMVNGLFDFGDDAGWGGYRRRRRRSRPASSVLGDSDSDIAMAGPSPASTLPVSDNIDIGVKYRYFRTGKLTLRHDDFDDRCRRLGAARGARGTASNRTACC